MVARWFEARVTVLHVSAPPRAVARMATTAAAVLIVEPSFAAAALTGFVNAVPHTGVAADQIVLEDLDAEGRILDIAASPPADMIETRREGSALAVRAAAGQGTSCGGYGV